MKTMKSSGALPMQTAISSFETINVTSAHRNSTAHISVFQEHALDEGLVRVAKIPMEKTVGTSLLGHLARSFRESQEESE